MNVLAPGESGRQGDRLEDRFDPPVVGAAVGALTAGVVADALDLDYAILLVAALTAISGFIAWGTLQRGAAIPLTPAVGG